MKFRIFIFCVLISCGKNTNNSQTPEKGDEKKLPLTPEPIANPEATATPSTGDTAMFGVVTKCSFELFPAKVSSRRNGWFVKNKCSPVIAGKTEADFQHKALAWIETNCGNQLTYSGTFNSQTFSNCKSVTRSPNIYSADFPESAKQWKEINELNEICQVQKIDNSDVTCE